MCIRDRSKSVYSLRGNCCLSQNEQVEEVFHIFPLPFFYTGLLLAQRYADNKYYLLIKLLILGKELLRYASELWFETAFTVKSENPWKTVLLYSLHKITLLLLVSSICITSSKRSSLGMHSVFYSAPSLSCASHEFPSPHAPIIIPFGI